MLKQGRLRVVLLGLLGLLCAGGVWAADLPPPPAQHVLDEPQVLQGQTRTVLSQRLLSHEQKTGQQIVFAIFESAQGDDPASRTNAIFKAWKLGQKGQDNGVLLALYWKEHRARIEVGYGLEATLTDAKSKNILAHILSPALKAGNPDQGLLQTADAVLDLLQNSTEGGGIAPRAQGPSPVLHFSWVWVVLGLLLATVVYRVLAPTREGRFRRARLRPRGFFPFLLPWPGSWGRRPPPSGPGGNDIWKGGGGGFGDGGFGSGGGGSSGGGGAGSDW